MIQPSHPCHGIFIVAVALLIGTSAHGIGTREGGDGDACAWQLELLRPRSGQLLSTVKLDRDQPGFSLSYIHSVFLTSVESSYRIEDGQIVQKAESYTDPGYGMESVNESNRQGLEQDRGRLWLSLDRSIPNLVVRVQRIQNNQITDPVQIDLGREYGDGPILFRPTESCSE